MINKTAIRSMASQASYVKGQELFYQQRVQELTVEAQEKGHKVEAQVLGSGSNQYHVSIGIDIRTGSVSGTYCECPAYYSYRGICKHCVAVLLAYNRYLATQQLGTGGLPRRIRSSSGIQFTSGGAAGKPSGSRQQTTPGMKNLLTQKLLRHTFPITQKEYLGKVRLEPWLELGGNEIKLEIRIGVTQMYIVKDIFELVKAVERAEFLSYGKKLAFVHTREAFQEESAPFVEFLLNWAAENEKHYRMANYYGMTYGTTRKLRQVSLSCGELEELLEALPGDRIIVEDSGERVLSVLPGIPDIPVRITGNKDGITVETELSEMFHCKYSYVFFEQEGIYKVPKAELEPAAGFLESLMAERGGRGFIQKEDIPLFCREVLPGLEKLCDCVMEGFVPEEYSLGSVSFEIYLDMPQRDYVTCNLYALYKDRKEQVFGAIEQTADRDFVRELEVSGQITPYFNAYDEKRREMVLAEDEEKLYRLLTGGIARMQELGEVYITDSMKKLRVAPAPRISVGVSLEGNLLELKLSSVDMSLEELAELLGKYDRRKRFHRLKNGDFIDTSADSIGELSGLQEGMNLTVAQIRTGRVSLPRFRALYLDEELKEWNGVTASRDRAFRALVRNMKTVEDNDFEVPVSLADVLREYQKKGFLWLKTLKYNGFGGILADDMGLGKTLQVIAFLVSEYAEDSEEQRNCLVVTPASLIYNWKSEMEKFAPGLLAVVVAGSAAERRRILEEAGKQAVFVTSYDLLKRDLELYQGRRFFCQVIDEAQYIKNNGTQAARAVKTIEAGFRLALTGTPVENRLSELWSIFDYLMPGFLYSYARFRKEIELPVVQNKEEEAAVRLQKMIRPFVLRRLKKDVLTDLPDKLEENLTVRMEGEQQMLYDAQVRQLQLLLEGQSEEEFRQSRIQVLTALTRLRQLCCDPSLVYENYKEESAKTEMCIQLLRNAVNGGHKVLLFSQFTTMLDKLTERMEAEDISYYLLTGATGKERRRELVELFNQDETSVFCISLKAGGTGLNLTAADIVIHFDPWWNLAVQNQATDRAHRIGQTNVVTVYKLIVKNSIEESIVRLQARKSMLADQILGRETMDASSLSREELLELLK